MAENYSKRKRLLITAATGFLLLGAAIFLYWLLVLRFEQYTDDAYVNGNMIELTPQVPGIVTSIHADNTDYVKEGDVILELDKTDYTLAFEKSKEMLASTVRNVVQMFLQVEQLEAELEVKKAELLKAEQDYNNRVNLVEIGGVSKEEFEHVEAALKSAYASMKESYYALESAYAQVVNTTVCSHPLVKKGSDEVKNAWVNLNRCEIVSPANGYVTQRKVQLGEWVNPSEPLLAVIPLDEIWVDANFKEIQLSKMRIGQSAKVTADIYGRKIVYHGEVIGINPGTGSVFSALPPQNATGNWIKIVQRVPVRILLEESELKKYPLWLGLSMEVTVDIKNPAGEMLAKAKPLKPIYQTKIYKRQEEGVSPIIQGIIEENIGPSGSRF